MPEPADPRRRRGCRSASDGHRTLTARLGRQLRHPLEPVAGRGRPHEPHHVIQAIARWMLIVQVVLTAILRSSFCGRAQGLQPSGHLSRGHPCSPNSCPSGGSNASPRSRRTERVELPPRLPGFVSSDTTTSAPMSRSAGASRDRCGRGDGAGLADDARGLLPQSVDVVPVPSQRPVLLPGQVVPH